MEEKSNRNCFESIGEDMKNYLNGVKKLRAPNCVKLI